MPISPDKIKAGRELFEKGRKGTLWTTRNKIIALLALLYVISPIDLLPDVIAIIGWLDDLGVIAAAAGWIATHRAPTLPEAEEAPARELQD